MDKKVTFGHCAITVPDAAAYTSFPLGTLKWISLLPLKQPDDVPQVLLAAAAPVNVVPSNMVIVDVATLEELSALFSPG
jgi:hypothetical protein